MRSREAGFWFLQATGWLLFAYLVYAQAIPALDYDLGVRMGTQEPALLITDVGVAFWYGFAFADAVFYIPASPASDGLQRLPLIAAWGLWGLWWVLRSADGA